MYGRTWRDLVQEITALWLMVSGDNKGSADGDTRI